MLLRQAATKVTLDDQYFAVLSGENSLQSPDYHQMDNRYDIEVGGSASDLTITMETVEQSDGRAANTDNNQQ